MNEIYLAETEAQIEDLLNRIDNDRGLWIALTPFAMASLDARKIQYSVPEDFYTNEELWQVWLESFEIVNELCKRLDKLAFSKSPELKKRKLSLYQNYNYPLYLVFYAIFSRIFELTVIFAKLKPDKIFCCNTEKYPFFWRGIGFDNRESLYSRILQECNWKENIHFIPVGQARGDTSASRSCSGAFSKKINNFKTMIKEKIPILWQIKRFGLPNFLKIAPILLRNNKNLAIIGAGYEWDECEFCFNLNGVSIKKLNINFEECGFPVQDDNLRQEMLREIKDLLFLKGINVADLLIPRLSFIYKVGQERCIEAYDEAVRSINKNNPRALLFSTLCTPELRSAGLAFKQRKILAFCKSHGAVGAFEITKILDNELLYADYYLANADMAVSLYRRVAKGYSDNNLEVTSTGSPVLEALKYRAGKIPPNLDKWIKEKKNGEKSNKRIGLYATTFYVQNLPNITSYPAFSDRILFKTQKTIISFFKNRPDCSLIWKLHPNRICDRPPFIENGSDNIFIIRDEAQFSDLITIADFIIIDSPFTACLQSMTRSLPMFLVMKHVIYLPEARKMLERRAVCCEEPEDLIKKVENFLLSGRYEADTNDDNFLKAYGTGYDGTPAVERTVSKVLSSIK